MVIKVVENGIIPQIVYELLFVFRCNYGAYIVSFRR